MAHSATPEVTLASEISDAYGTDTLRLVLAGLTGTGKSAMGNSILAVGHLSAAKLWNRATRPFRSQADPESVTVNCKKEDTTILGHKVSLVDTPGFIDTRRSNEETLQELLQCLFMLAPGPHAILLVVKLGRFTAEVVQGIEKMKRIFGEDCIKFMIVVFTHTDSLEDDEPLEEFVDRISGSPRKLLEECRMRYIGFNNKFKLTSSDNQEQVKKLLSMVKAIAKYNGGRCYTQELLDKAQKIEEEKRKKIEEAKAAAEKAEKDRVQKLQEEAARRAQEQERVKQEAIRRQESRQEAERLRMALEKEKREREAFEAKMRADQARQKEADRRARIQWEAEHARKIEGLKEELRRKTVEAGRNRGGGGRCFSSDSVVRVLDCHGHVTVKSLEVLAVGDRVQSYDRETNSVTYSPVYFITYQDDNESKSSLRELFYQGSDCKEHSLRLQGKHLLYATINPSASLESEGPPSTPIMSEKVNVGDVLWVIDDDDTGELCPRRVLKIGEIEANVRHPMTMNHIIIVDGVLASVHMHNEWLLRQATAPLRLLYKINPHLSDFWFPKKAVQCWDYVEHYFLE
ncbi:uncharacterized protein [Amphiura filiformis]|uniref:uncharacterized protein n=1 Tax=Amphiura filiformis TaxID=82378 RepID=UPI003B2283E5